MFAPRAFEPLSLAIQGGVWFLLVAVPFHSVLIFPGMSVVKAIGVVLAPVWLLWAVIRLTSLSMPLKLSRTAFSALMSSLGLLAAIFLSLLYAPPSPVFVPSTLTIFSGIVMAVIIATTLSSETGFRKAYSALTLGGAIAASLVIAEFVAPENVSKFFQQQIFIEGEVVRVTGPFRDPNYCALTLIVLACFSFYSALTSRKQWRRTLLSLGVVVQVIAVLLTFSRAGYITLALVGSTVLWRERFRLPFWKVALVATTGLVLLATVGEAVIDLIAARTRTVVEFAQLLGKEPAQARQVDLSLWYRFQLLQAGVKMAFNRFPIGVGWENFRYQVTQYSDEVRQQGAHNTYIAVAAELGLPGLIALIWLLWALWRTTGTLCKTAQGRFGLYVRGTRYGLLAVLIGGLFLTVLHEAVVWALIGLIMAQNRITFKLMKGGYSLQG